MNILIINGIFLPIFFYGCKEGIVYKEKRRTKVTKDFRTT